MAATSRSSKLIITFGAVTLLLSVLATAAAAQSLFEQLFGLRPAVPAQEPPARTISYAPSYAPHDVPRPSITITPRPMVIYSSYCVRLCDGRFFPIPMSMNATPAQLCNSLCPSTTTKVFAGTEIAQAMAPDGTRYTKLENAFAFRDRVVPDCSCTGKGSFGLAMVDIDHDPTLRPGDLISTKKGLVTYMYAGRTMYIQPARRKAAVRRPRAPVAAVEARTAPRVFADPFGR